MPTANALLPEPASNGAGERIADPRRGQTTWSGAPSSFAVVPGAAGLRFDFEHHAFDRHDTHGVARVNRRRSIRARAPQRVANAHHTVRIDVGFGATHLADELLAADGRRRET